MNIRYRPEEAAKIIGVASSTLAKWRGTGEGPEFEKLGRKIIVYSEESLEEFVSKRSHASTSEYQTNPGSGRPRSVDHDHTTR